MVEESAARVPSRMPRKVFTGSTIAAVRPDAISVAALQEGDADLVAFGRHFVATPDLPHRVCNNLPFDAYNRNTFYGGDRAATQAVHSWRAPRRESRTDGRCGTRLIFFGVLEDFSR